MGIGSLYHAILAPAGGPRIVRCVCVHDTRPDNSARQWRGSGACPEAVANEGLCHGGHSLVLFAGCRLVFGLNSFGR